MGNVQSGSTLTRTSGALDSFVTELGGGVVYDKGLNQARFLKTVKCRHRNGYLVVKIFIKQDPEISLRSYQRKLKADREALLDIPNIYTYQTFFETEKAGYLIRQWAASNLYDRISTRPFLSAVEKKWIAYQLLTALSQAHLHKTPHGDIKSTNILVTSSNWIYVTDFAGSLKPTRLPLDDPSDFSFFFDTSGRRICYVAPERFYKVEREMRKAWTHEEGERKEPAVTEAMDVFSAGCVIAEVFLEGASLFSLSQLFKYREGEYSVEAQLSAIGDEGIRSMIRQMISLDPAARPSFDILLASARGTVLPECFYSFLHEYVASVGERPSTFPFPSSSYSTSNVPRSTHFSAATPSTTIKVPSKETVTTSVGGNGNDSVLPGDSDHRLERIWEDYDNVDPYLLDDTDIEKTVMDVKVEFGSNIVGPSKPLQDVFPVSLHIPSYSSNRHPTPAEDGPALILLSLVLANIRNCLLPSSRLRALDVLLALSTRLTDEAKLDRAVPYIVELLRDEAAIVRAAAVRTLVQILTQVNVITPSNASILPEYIIPNVRYLVQDPEVSVRAMYAQCIAPLAQTADRFLEMGQALKAHGVSPGINGDRQEYEEMHLEVSYDVMKQDLLLSIQEQLSTLLMDPSPVVKRAVLHNINALCVFLGSQRTNDVVLSHMITYLNDRDWLLRHAFFESIVDVAACAGGRSLDEYILPLMVQALSDVEESVVARVLTALTSLCELGLFQKMRIWELMSATLAFFYHPNVWIRQGAASFIAAAAKCLPQSDVWCILYPSLRHLLRSDVKQIEEQSLLSAMKPSLLRPVFDGAVQWAMRAEKTTFWRGQRRPASKVESPRESIVSMRKGGSTTGIGRNKSEEDEVQLLKLQNLGMTPADETKLTAMRDYILKLANNASSFASRPRTELELEKNLRTMGDVELQKLSVVPQTVFLKSKFSTSDLTPRPSRLSSYSRRPFDVPGRFGTPRMSRASSVDRGATNPTLEDLKRRLAAINSSSSSLNLTAAARERQAVQSPSILPSTTQPATLAPPAQPLVHDRPSSPTDSVVSTTNSSTLRTVHRLQIGSTDGQKAAPAIGSSNANAVGLLEAPSKMRSEGSPERSGRSSPISMAGTAKGVNRPRMSSMIPISTYDGPEPGINNLLENIYSDSNRELQHDFGPKVHEGPIRRRNTTRQSFITRDSSNRRTEATLIAHLQSHSDCVTGLAVSPDHAFFISCSDDMSVKVWDTARLERSVTSKPRHTYTQHHARVKCVCMLEGVHCFASAAEDGSLHVVRVHVNQSGSLPKYGKLQTIREYRVGSPAEYITCMVHYNSDVTSNLVLATTHSVITILDLRTMQILQHMQNPRHFGPITCMCLDRKRTWILVGTSMGVLSLWDRRFGLLLKSWQVGKTSSGKSARVNQCIIHPTKGKGTWVMVAVESWKGGSESSPTTLIEVWDIKNGVLVESYTTRTTSTPTEFVPEPAGQSAVDAQQSPAAAIAALVNARYPGGPANVTRNGGSSQITQHDETLPAPSHDICAIVTGIDFGHSGVHRSEIVDLSTDAPTSSRNSRGFMVTGSEDRRIRLWDLSKLERTSIVAGPESEHDKPSYSTVRTSDDSPYVSNVETWVHSSSSGSQSNRPPQRMSMITHNQQNLLKSHQDIVTCLACIDSPFRGGIVSADRAGVIKVWRVGSTD
ncbi:ARM repeat-containing protein [Rhizopogon vinicolor AM-OR11-026]|uniref:non-specific serine/threonine protein kinase n=1 Tax=Rhizopogon vinicolor AM-OR11-026 TaxID=1314800 RepID=A0A1B7NG16_9AGAM|nr:ARM repeat-containing protein [Rhizopogon vinicolor AM-OR11-026]